MEARASSPCHESLVVRTRFETYAVSLLCVGIGGDGHLGDIASLLPYGSKTMSVGQIRTTGGFFGWCRNIVVAVTTVARSLWVTMRYWIRTYNPARKTFTELYEYPELPVEVAPRYRGFHRFDLTTCIACERCARDCPVDCIYIGKAKVEGRKGFRVTSFVIDYSKCMFCAMCTENCPVDCIFMGSTHDLSCYSRDGCLVDFSRLPLEIAWGRTTLNPTAVSLSKQITEAVHQGPN